MGLKPNWRKIGKGLASSGKSVAKVAKGAVATVYRDTKAGVVYAAKTGEQFTPGGIVKSFSSTGGIGLLTVAGIFGIGALILLSRR